MNVKMIGRFLGQIVAMEGVFLLPALGISLYCSEWSAVRSIGISIGVMLAIAAVLWLICRRTHGHFGPSEGMVCVGLSWIVLSFLGCLPFYISGHIPKFIDALFEIVSGFTTTGSSILSDVEALPKGLLYWRSFSHWLGGMGVLVFLLAISPSDRKGGGFTMHLLRAESPGPDVGKLVPRMKNTAMILYTIYIVMTLVNIIALLLGGMSVFEAVCTAFGTAGTGGFGIKNDSLASYSPYLQNVTTVFMFLFGVNFSCYYLLLLRNIKGVFKDEELRLYIGLVLTAIVLIVLNVRPLYGSVKETIRHTAFQVSSIITTTGYATTDFDLWPMFSKGILLMLMVVGACAGSTGGGLKCARVLLLFKIPYESYNQGGQIINMFLAPATACLAVSIYSKLELLKKNWLPITVGAACGSLTYMASIWLMCRLFGLDEAMTASLMPKSVTTPIAIGISENNGGIVPITVVAVIFTGILGSILAPVLIKIFKVDNPMVAGLSIGACSHAVGTSKAVELGETQGAMSGLAIGICGIMTVIFSLVLMCNNVKCDGRVDNVQPGF